MQGGQRLHGHFHAEVAARNHDAIHDGDDVVDVIDCGLRLDFGYDFDVLAAVLEQEVLEHAHIVRARHERRGDVVHILFDAEEDVLFVLLAEIGHIEVHAHHIDALVVGQRAADEDLEHDRGVLDLFDFHFGESVVDEQDVAGLNHLVEVGAGDARLRGVAVDGGVDQPESVARCDLDAVADELAEADFGTSGIEHQCDRHGEFLAYLLDEGDALCVLLVGGVTHVETRHIHARIHHVAEH